MKKKLFYCRVHYFFGCKAQKVLFDLQGFSQRGDGRFGTWSFKIGVEIWKKAEMLWCNGSNWTSITVAYLTPETLVVDLWFIEKQMEKKER
jgi:hypothetical protein